MQKTVKHTSSQYIGVENMPVVNIGTKVYKGMLLAKSEDGQSQIYSTLTGVVKKITRSAILIEIEKIVDEEPEVVEKPEVIEQSDEQPVKPTKRMNVDALDGLRTLAIISVIFYHLGFNWYKGGLLGVTIFFVLSGYLITGILINEIGTSGKINLKRFWIHRVRRLFPAICIVVVAVALLCILFNHLLLTKMKPDIIPSLVWMQNWWYILRDMSYFESLGAPSPLVHFWSLAIEEQFYLIWPLVLIGAYKLGFNNKLIRRICVGLAVLSALAMVIMYNPNADPTRVYYGTDTRAFSLLIGAWLAYVWPWHNLESGIAPLRKLSTKHFDIIGGVSLGALILIMIFVDGLSPAMYYGVLFLTSLLSAAIIATLVVPDSQLAKVFAFKPLVWVGKRSYGMYLWHLPIILLLVSALNVNGDEIWFGILVIAIVIAVSALQYKYIENPIRKKAISKWYANWKSRKFVLNTKEIVFAVVGAALIVVTIIGVIATPDEFYVPEEEVQSTGEDIEHAAVVQQQYYPLLIGDSVPAALSLTESFPMSLNDSVIGRWTWQATNVLQEYANQGALSNVVVIACFSNHQMNPDDLDNMYKITGPDRQLFLVNSCCPFDYCAINNSQILDFARKYENVHIIDWFGAAMNIPDKYFYDDKVHINGAGRALYTHLLADAINPYLPDNCKCDVSKIDALYANQ